MSKGFLDRTLAAYQNKEPITPYIEEALLHANWPEEYPVKVYNKERIFDWHYHPSSDIEAGEYQLYYKFHPKWHDSYKEERPSPTLQMTFQVGSAIHSIIQSMFIHLEFTTQDLVEVKFRNEDRNLTGAVDILKLTTPKNEDFIVDIKSTNRIPFEASHKYKQQLRVYQDNCPGAPDRMAIVFIEKPYPHKIKTIEVFRDDEELSELYGKWDRVQVAIRNNDKTALRPCCTGPTDPTFLTCPARGICELWN